MLVCKSHYGVFTLPGARTIIRAGFSARNYAKWEILKHTTFVFRQSYDVDIELTVPGTNTKSTNTLDLKNPFFRYTGVQPQPPPGNNHQSPSDAYWSNTDPTGNSPCTVDLIHVTKLVIEKKKKRIHVCESCVHFYFSHSWSISATDFQRW